MADAREAASKVRAGKASYRSLPRLPREGKMQTTPKVKAKKPKK